ncbi:RNA polymerase sigma factor [Bacillus sp. AGMB 02131]|uniref:RNA polymerase sigma factor n=1 Tax=Peribacillus faecalis TaxID=2772559 RepID=A0A927CU72_9BACI|nr:RNA polymerase sigma factor [Peribacillus faecalis]MBD3107536.1 RNA polymerase sigma factor [Peribacillus faecalis]
MKIETIEDLYQQKVLIIFKHLVSIGCSKEDAEDIVQNTFYKAIENMIHLEVTNISAWLFKVSIHQFYDLCRRSQRFPKVNIDDDAFISFFIQEETGEDFVLLKELHGDVHNLLDELKPSYKNLLVLKYDLGLSYEEISVMLDMKVETIRTTLYRARKEFKQKWREKNERRS